MLLGIAWRWCLSIADRNPSIGRPKACGEFISKLLGTLGWHHHLQFPLWACLIWGWFTIAVIDQGEIATYLKNEVPLNLWLSHWVGFINPVLTLCVNFGWSTCSNYSLSQSEMWEGIPPKEQAESRTHLNEVRCRWAPNVRFTHFRPKIIKNLSMKVSPANDCD